MFRLISIVLLSMFCSVSFAGETACKKIAEISGGPENNFRPPLEAVVIGNGRLYFYSAPNVQCQMKGVFVVKGDALTLYQTFEGWAEVMYIAKGGDDFMGWVKEDRVKVRGQYGNNP
ncbi:MAG: hypothetical protein ABI144_02745 [Gallionella sp.]